MKSILILVWIFNSLGFIDACTAYKHKSEEEIARLTPAQRVDAWVDEQVHHKYDLSDNQGDMIKKYILRDGLKALPRMIEIIDEYEPRSGRGGERFDAACILFDYIDELAVRLRGSEQGRKAMDALERAIERSRIAGHGQEDQHEWEQHGRLTIAVLNLRAAKGINDTDEAIRNTLRRDHGIRISDAELLELSNFFVARYPEHPSWSERDFINIEEGGKPLPGLILKNPQRTYDAYLEFKRGKGE